MNQTENVSQQSFKTDEQKKLARANIRLALVLGAVVLFALASTFYYFFGLTVTVPN